MSETLSIQDIVDVTYDKYRNVDDGEVATYIPELSKADPRDFAICLVTVDGKVFSAGDWEKEFTLQSICKPFAFQMSLEEFGREGTLARVGVEPSGDAFNSIELDPRTMRPFNPMVNAGAIAVASLIKKGSAVAGVRAFVDKMQLAAGRKLKIDSSVLASESATGNRNRAIAYLMLNFGIIDEDINHTLHQYFSQCSLEGLSYIGGFSSNILPMAAFGNLKAMDFWKKSIILITTGFLKGLLVFAANAPFDDRLGGQCDQRQERQH